MIQWPTQTERLWFRRRRQRAGRGDLWAQAKANFTYPSGCSGTCGHYTQIVWRTSVNLGCALVDCPNLQYRGTVLCNYGPGGNSGGAPY